jgi:hypothetical protein
LVHDSEDEIRIPGEIPLGSVEKLARPIGHIQNNRPVSHAIFAEIIAVRSATGVDHVAFAHPVPEFR